MLRPRKLLKRPGYCSLAMMVLLLAAAVRAEEFFPRLQVGSETYSNVTVTSVTSTDIYFTHALGMGNAKLRNLTPELQKHFNYDPAQADAADQRRYEANATYRQDLAAAKPAQVAPADEDSAAGDDPVAPALYARSFLGQRPPSIIVDQWLTPPPDVEGKFVLVNFWSTTCEPCKDTVLYLNGLSAKFKDKLAVIGLSAESSETVRQAAPKIAYHFGVDEHARTQTALEVRALPHSILIDPKGVVRYEGVLAPLTEKALKHLIAKYGQ